MKTSLLSMTDGMRKARNQKAADRKVSPRKAGEGGCPGTITATRGMSWEHKDSDRELLGQQEHLYSEVRQEEGQHQEEQPREGLPELGVPFKAGVETKYRESGARHRACQGGFFEGWVLKEGKRGKW